jgi:MFS transporter, DHA3 family, macrolide efflux protein
VAIASAISLAGPLTDYIFEPALMPSGMLAPILNSTFGVGPGAGTALLFELCAGCMTLIGIARYLIPALQDIDNF